MESKKGVLWKILKWIGRVVFAVFILALVYFQAPIKVITFFLIFLLAGIFLKKPYYKYFWLTVLAVVIGLTVWVFLPEGDEEWYTYELQNEIDAINLSRQVPKDQDASFVYYKILEENDPETFWPDFLTEDITNELLSKPFTSEQYPDVSQWLKSKQSLLEQLKVAFQYPYCIFPYERSVLYQEGIEDELDNLQKSFRQFSKLIILLANNDLGEGRVDEAIEKTIMLKGLSSHWYQQLSMLNYLVAISIEGLMLNQTKLIIVESELNESQINLLEEHLNNINFDIKDKWQQVTNYESFLTANTLCSMYYEINSEDTTRMKRYYLSYSSKNRKTNVRQKIGSIRVWFLFPQNPEKIESYIDDIYDEYFKYDVMLEGKKDFDEFPLFTGELNHKLLLNMFIKILAPAFDKVYELSLRQVSNINATKIVLALRKYKNANGDWPESLDKIKDYLPEDVFIDPLNGSGYVYKLTDENFMIYSIGQDKIDDGGKSKKSYRENEKGLDDYTFWPITKCRT